MFNRLRKKWDVSPKQFWIIFIAFGFTGLTTAYITKVINVWLGMDDNTWWVWRWSVKLAMLLIGYQVLLLFYGALFGQWAFFWKYEKKLLMKLGIMRKSKVESRKSKIESETLNAGGRTLNAEGKTQEAGGERLEAKQETPSERLSGRAGRNKKQETRIAIFASGTGTNAEKIIEYFSTNEKISVTLIVCNKPGAGVLSVASRHNISTLLIEKERFFRGDGFVPELQKHQVDFIVLAGFLWKIPQSIIDSFRGNIVNIHPALLPKFGGKGMYGANVHAAVIEAGEKESGITIHLVDEHYDNGDILFQGKCEVAVEETPASLAKKIHVLEHAHYPEVIEKLIKQNFSPAENAD